MFIKILICPQLTRLRLLSFKFLYLKVPIGLLLRHPIRSILIFVLFRCLRFLNLHLRGCRLFRRWLWDVCNIRLRLVTIIVVVLIAVVASAIVVVVTSAVVIIVIIVSPSVIVVIVVIATSPPPIVIVRDKRLRLLVSTIIILNSLFVKALLDKILFKFLFP